MNIIPDWKLLLVQAAGFILLLLVFKVFLFRPVLGVLEARRSEVEGQYQSAEDRRQEAEELKAQYERHLASIEEETRAKIADALKEGQSMRDEIIADSRAKAEQILTRAQEQIEREREAAFTDLRTRIADLTVAAAGKIIGEELDAQRHRALVNAFIDDLDGVTQ